MQISPVSLTTLASPSASPTAAASTQRTDTAGFADQVARAANASAAPASSSSVPVAEGTPSVFEQLETLLVQQMMQTMLSSEEGGFFGEGLGSDYYASFMAEHFGAALSESLDLGIASQLEGRFESGKR